MVYESPACSACAQHANCNTSSPLYGTRLNLCDDGVVQLAAQHNQTFASPMCCQYALRSADDTAVKLWQCQPYSGPRDGGASVGLMLSSYQCFNPTPALSPGSDGLFECSEWG